MLSINALTLTHYFYTSFNCWQFRHSRFFLCNAVVLHHKQASTYSIAADLCVGVTQRSVGFRFRHGTLCTGASKQVSQGKHSQLGQVTRLDLLGWNSNTALRSVWLLWKKREMYLPRTITVSNKKNKETILKLARSRLPEKQKAIYAGRQHC